MKKYKKIIILVSLFLSVNSIVLAEQKDNNFYNELNTEPVIMEATDTSLFKPAAIKSLSDYDEHYRLYKYDVISIRIIGFRDAQGLDQIVIGTDGYVNLPYAGSVMKL